MIIQFVEHSALLLALCWLMTLNTRCWQHNNNGAKLISGLLFGVTCVVGMMMAMELDSGWVFDARSVVLSIAAFVSGPFVAIVAGMMAASYRVWLGGAGMVGGVFVIAASVLLGLSYRYLHQKGKVSNGLISLFLFGLLVHIGLLGHFLLLPDASDIVVQAGIAMLVVMPLTTVCLGWLLEDIKRRNHNERELQIAATAFEVRQGMLVSDKDRRILRVNQAFTAVTGYQAEELVGLSTSLFHSDRHDAAFYAHMQQQLASLGHWQGEIWSHRKNGDVYPVWLSMNAVRNPQGKITHYVSSVEDLSERKAAEARIHHLASFDELTGLPNRSLLFNRVKQAIEQAEKNQRYACLLFIDLDGFKSIKQYGITHVDL